MQLRPDIKLRHSKPLDVRTHKAAWLNIEYLRKQRDENKHFTEHTLQHPHKLAVEHCPVCNGTSRTVFGATYGMTYFDCAQCHHVYAEFILRAEDLSAYYANNYFADSVYLDKAQAKSRARTLLEPKLEYVAQFAKPHQKRWLDVGTGNGGVVAVARAMGFESHGVELGTDAVKFAREVYEVELGHHDLYREFELRGANHYDIVSFFMVLEHVTDPAEQVRCAHKIVKPDGLLVIEIPKADSVAAMTDVRWPDQGLRQLVGSHVMNYTLESVSWLIEKNGFSIEGMWFMGQDVFSLVTHLALQDPSFLQSPLCNYFLDNNNVLQQAIDQTHQSDEVVVVARKL